MKDIFKALAVLVGVASAAVVGVLAYKKIKEEKKENDIDIKFED